MQMKRICGAENRARPEPVNLKTGLLEVFLDRENILIDIDGLDQRFSTRGPSQIRMRPTMLNVTAFCVEHN